MVITSRGKAGLHSGSTHSGGKPPHSMRCHAPARRLRIRKAFGVRLLAGAVEEQHCARRPTTPRPASTNDRSFWGSDHTHRWKPKFHRGSGPVYPNGRPWPEDGKGPPAELLLHADGDVAGGRLKTRPRESVGFLSKGCNSLFEPPSSCPRLVLVRAAAKSKDLAFLWASFLRALKKASAPFASPPSFGGLPNRGEDPY